MCRESRKSVTFARSAYSLEGLLRGVYLVARFFVKCVASNSVCVSAYLN
jgi:hypothetical protein